MKIIITIENDNYESVNVEVINKRTEDDTRREFDDEIVSPYARFFDCDNPNWHNSIDYNLMWLKSVEHLASDRLAIHGFIFLNDVYDMLGMPRSKAGQLVGWIYDEKNPIGDNYVDFGIYEKRNSSFVNGFGKSILLDFNVDGNILDHLE